MKRVVAGIIILNCFSFAGVWSSMATDNIQGAFGSLNALISAKEEGVRQIWSSQINPLLESIRDNTTEKKTILEQVVALQQKINIQQKNKLFLMEQEKKLLGKLIDVEAIIKK